MDVRGFGDLRVWQAAMDLVEMTYKVSVEFPRHETYGLTSQIRLSAISIPSNIAEGHSRHHTKEYLKFLSVAQGSLAELQNADRDRGQTRIRNNVSRKRNPPPLSFVEQTASRTAKRHRKARRVMFPILTCNADPQPPTPNLQPPGTI